ncbi:MAG TPA: GlsB/YeaQ/YmgE family stress response membrane protein [Steroidobacteraceae bacterium]
MNFIIWLFVGGVIGWLASLVMWTDARQGIVLNVVVGVVGALLGGWLLSPLLGAGSINQQDFSLLGLLVSFGGAVILLLVVNLVRTNLVRTGRAH